MIPRPLTPSELLDQLIKCMKQAEKQGNHVTAKGLAIQIAGLKKKINDEA